jgi:protein TonB
MAGNKRIARWMLVLLGAPLSAVVVYGFVILVRNILDKPAQPSRPTVQIVQLMRPPPPPVEPPPPPPPEEKIEEPLDQAKAEDTPPEEAAPSEQLGLDADGSAGADGFGLAARKGGRDLIGGGASFGWYTTLLRDSIQDVLAGDDRIRKGNYQVQVRVWMAADGTVEKVLLAQSTGDADLDGYIRVALGRLGKLRDSPPIEMPQPVTLRIVSRG